MHGRRIIHRDIKLGNCFLDGNMQVKIGDFGLAIELPEKKVNIQMINKLGEQNLGESEEMSLRHSICGTPNYMPPEILAALDDESSGVCGYSFSADIWSLGVMMYIMLIGRAPFECKDVKDTYKRIKNVKYMFPTCEQRKQNGQEEISYEAIDLITMILQKDPKMRPSLH